MKWVKFIIVILTSFVVQFSGIYLLFKKVICIVLCISHSINQTWLSMFLAQEGIIIAKYPYVYGGGKWEEREERAWNKCFFLGLWKGSSIYGCVPLCMWKTELGLLTASRVLRAGYWKWKRLDVERPR